MDVIIAALATILQSIHRVDRVQAFAQRKIRIHYLHVGTAGRIRGDAHALHNSGESTRTHLTGDIAWLDFTDDAL